MPKRWIVTYSGPVFDAMNGPNGNQFVGLTAKPPTREVVADEMEVEGGSIIFVTGGEVTLVLGPTTYWVVELEDSGDTSSGDTSSGAGAT